MVYSADRIVDQVDGGICYDGDGEPFHIFFRQEVERKILDLYLPSLVAPEVLSGGNGAKEINQCQSSKFKVQSSNFN